MVSLTSTFKFNLSVGPADTVKMLSPWQDLSLVFCCPSYPPSPLMIVANLGYFDYKILERDIQSPHYTVCECGKI